MKPTILYVEDEDGIRDNLTQFLNYFSSKVYVAVDGEDGVSKHRRYKPDIIISDIKMPKKDGLDMARDIRKVDKDVFIIFTTAFNETDYLLNAIDLSIDGYDFTVYGLKGEYQQVILNLINNAKDALLQNYTQHRYIKIYVENQKVLVEDNGGGIDSNIIDKVFEPYFTTKEQGKGTGMGLYMSKMIIEENMQSSLEVENGKNGAVFSIVFSGITDV